MLHNTSTVHADPGRRIYMTMIRDHDSDFQAILLFFWSTIVQAKILVENRSVAFWLPRRAEPHLEVHVPELRICEDLECLYWPLCTHHAASRPR